MLMKTNGAHKGSFSPASGVAVAGLFVLSLLRVGFGGGRGIAPPPGAPRSPGGERPGEPGPGSQAKPTRSPALGNASRATLEIIRVTNY